MNRDMINSGKMFKAIKGYSEGKYSIGKAANLADFPLSEFMDLVMGLGIKSKIDLDSIVEGYENLKKYL